MKSGLTTQSHRNSIWNLLNEVDQIFGNDYFQGRAPAQTSNFQPLVDVVEEENHLLVSADLPGMKKEDIHLDLSEGVLTLSGERVDEKKSSDKHYRRFEKTYGKFMRSFRLPETVDRDGIEAQFENGVLEVLIPKSEKILPQKIEVKESKDGLFSKFLGKKDEGKH